MEGSVHNNGGGKSGWIGGGEWLVRDQSANEIFIMEDFNEE